MGPDLKTDPDKIAQATKSVLILADKHRLYLHRPACARERGRRRSPRQVSRGHAVDLGRPPPSRRVHVAAVAFVLYQDDAGKAFADTLKKLTGPSGQPGQDGRALVAFSHPTSARPPAGWGAAPRDGLVTAAQVDQAVARQPGRATGLGPGAPGIPHGGPARYRPVPPVRPPGGRARPARRRPRGAPPGAAQIARKYQVLPIERAGETLSLAMADPTDVNALDDVAFMTNLKVRPLVAAPRPIRQAVERLGEADGGPPRPRRSTPGRRRRGRGEGGRGAGPRRTPSSSWSRPTRRRWCG